MESRSYTRLRLVGKIKRGSSSDNKAINIPNRSSNSKAINIPDSLINFEILPRLPVESILRFRRVCKTWNSLTREKQFADRHMEFSKIRCNNNSTTNLSIIIHSTGSDCQLHCHGEDYHTQFELRNFPWATICALSNSCHGLICIFEQGSLCGGNKIYLVNPTINEVVTLPQAGSSHITCNLALVYDESTHKYKVVRIFHRLGTGKPGCEILTLGSSQTWRDIGDAPNCIPFSPEVVIGGKTIYWGNHSSPFDPEGATSFDIQSETFDVIIPPKGWTYGLHPISKPEVYYPELGFIELGGCLCIYRFQMVSTKIGIQYNYLNFCILEDCNNHKWTEHRINLEQLEDYHTMESHGFKPLSMHDGKVLFADLAGRFNFYDLENGKFLGKPIKLINGNAIPYFETLVSPKAIQEGRMDEGVSVTH